MKRFLVTGCNSSDECSLSWPIVCCDSREEAELFLESFEKIRNKYLLIYGDRQASYFEKGISIDEKIIRSNLLQHTISEFNNELFSEFGVLLDEQHLGIEDDFLVEEIATWSMK